MTVSRPAGLQAGVEVRLGGHSHVVIAVTGTSVRLEDAADGQRDPAGHGGRPEP